MTCGLFHHARLNWNDNVAPTTQPRMNWVYWPAAIAISTLYASSSVINNKCHQIGQCGLFRCGDRLLWD